MTRQTLLAAPLLAALAALPAFAQEAQPEDAAMTVSPIDAWLADPTTTFAAGDLDLAQFQWRARPIVVFADTEFDPAFQRQVDLLADRMDDLVERDVVVVLDTDPDARSELRRELRPRGFMLALVGKDGRVALRKPFPWDVREITRTIDKMPMRQQEIRDRRDQGS